MQGAYAVKVKTLSLTKSFNPVAMTEDNINYYYYLVAFIDILGQKEAFQGLGTRGSEQGGQPSKLEKSESKRFLISNFEGPKMADKMNLRGSVKPNLGGSAANQPFD